MKNSKLPRFSRRTFSRSLMCLGIALGSGLFAGVLRAQTSNSLRIGIIGSGRMGGAVGLRLAEAGHEVFFFFPQPRAAG